MEGEAAGHPVLVPRLVGIRAAEVPTTETLRTCGPTSAGCAGQQRVRGGTPLQDPATVKRVATSAGVSSTS